MASLFVGGVDVGSRQTKAIILDEDSSIVGRALIDTGPNIVLAAQRASELAIQDANISSRSVRCWVGTGYGRYKVSFGSFQITEISCHAKGACFLFPKTRTVIDMGGQDTKGIRVLNGEVIDFTMNDKCAAGTGRFLENAADVLGLSIDEIGQVSLRGINPVHITTVCTVFVESDIMSYLARGKKVEDILAGVHIAIASRTVSMVRRVGIEEEVTFTGGVSKNIAMVRALEEIIGLRINLSPHSHFMGAIGAALFGLERMG